MTVDSERDSRDLRFIRENRNDFFGGSNYYLGILRGIIKVPSTVTLIDDELSDREMQVLSFGQFVFHMALRRHLNMSSFAEKLGINQDDLVKIYDDSVFPWDLDPALIRRMGTVLGASIPLLRRIINNHPMDEWLLRQRFPQGFSAARTSYKLNQPDRSTELNETELLLQKDREAEKRNQFLTQL